MLKLGSIETDQIEQSSFVQTFGDKYLSVKEVAFMMAAHPSTIWRLVAAGNFPAPIKLGSMTRWSLQDVQTHMNVIKAGSVTSKTEGGKS